MARLYSTDDVLDYDGEPTRRLRPPGRLQGRARAIFVHIVKHTAATHFRATDQHLLERHCESLALAEAAADKLASEGAVVDGKPSPWFAAVWPRG
jgi:hypothetical protein